MNPAVAPTFLLGPLLGFLIARYIPDETQWYPKWMRIAAAVFLVAATFQFVNTSVLLFASSLLIVAGIILVFYGGMDWPVFVGFGLVGALSSTFGLQLLTISAIFVTTALYSAGKRNVLFLWVLTPILILAGQFLL